MSRTKLSQLKVVLLHNIVSPHVTPTFQLLAKEVDLTVLYCGQTEANRQWQEKPTGFSYQILPHYALSLVGKDIFTNFINPSLFKILNEHQPDVVVISGWDLISYQLAFWYCQLKGIPCVVWSGSTKFELSWRRTVSRPLVAAIVQRAQACIAYGTRAKQYLQSLGVPAHRITISFNTTDLDKYRHFPPAVTRQVTQLRKKWGWTHKTVILYYGQLIERKGVDTLIKAFRLLQNQQPDTVLLIIGSGQEKLALSHLASELQLSSVKFLADPGDAEMPLYYHLSDVFVLPSREEVWGLVVNQAMAASLPVIVSDKVGAGPDLVVPGKTGFVFSVDDSEGLSQLLEKLTKNPAVRTRLGQAAQRHVQITHPDKGVSQIVAVVKKIAK